ncbi:MAG: asparagine synthase (glutamine-hydrolyzing), partial [Bryobacteraceae bacterium]
RRELVLARDRFGKKPLYWAARPEGLYFSSELKCLEAAGVPTELDEQALRLYFLFSYIPDPWSAYRGVRKLGIGSWLKYDASGRVEEQRYWRLPEPATAPPPDASESQMRARIRETFDEAVRLRMIADVPLGAFLSGGIDSGSVVASMARQSAAPVKTFSIGFREDGFNELPQAALVARQYRTEHREIEVAPDSVALVERLVGHFDEPFGDESALPTWIVSEHAAAHVKVVLTGDGGDELFAGYSSLRSVLHPPALARLPRAARRVVALAAAALPYAAYGKNYLRAASRPTDLERYFEQNYAHYYLRERMLRPEWRLRPPYPLEAMAHCLLPDGAGIFSQAQHFEITAKLVGDMLVKVDRMSMAHSLEVRCPLLDHELAELAWRCPPEWKAGRGGRTGKKILIEALGDRLPAEIVTRPKQGFGVPLAAWFRGPLREFLWDHLASRRGEDRGVTEPAFVRRMLVEHDTGRRDNSHWLFGLLMLELWFRRKE